MNIRFDLAENRKYETAFVLRYFRGSYFTCGVCGNVSHTAGTVGDLLNGAGNTGYNVAFCGLLAGCTSASRTN